MAPYLAPGPDLPYQINAIVAFIMGMVFNSLLLWLINNKSPKELEGYGRVMRFGCYFDIYLLGINYSFQQVIANQSLTVGR